MPPFLDLVDDARIAARSLTDRLAGMRNPTLRLGVTGLSRSGKTVFITALVHALVRGCAAAGVPRLRGRPYPQGERLSRSPTMPCRASPTRIIWLR